MFYNELDMALLRMHILRDAVDYHVVVESKQTHSGQPKPLYFWEAFEAGVFDEFKDRIIYSCVNELEGAHSWAREAFHRAHIGKVLQYNAAPEDLVIIADCDEIPEPSAVHAIKQTASVNKNWNAFALELTLYYYDFHHIVDMGWGIGACLWGLCQDANAIRRCEFGVDPLRVENAGVHLSYFLTPEGVVDKLNAFMHHADEAAHVPRDPAWIAAKMQAGQDIFGRNIRIDTVTFNTSIPQYVLEHAEDYIRLGWLKGVTVIQHE